MPMNPERLRQIETLYIKVSALDQGEREDFLFQACAGDGALRKEIDSLLLHEKSAESFMEVDAFQQQKESLADGWKEITTALTGSTLGRYQVQEKIGAAEWALSIARRTHASGKPLRLKCCFRD